MIGLAALLASQAACGILKRRQASGRETHGDIQVPRITLGGDRISQSFTTKGYAVYDYIKDRANSTGADLLTPDELERFHTALAETRVDAITGPLIDGLGAQVAARTGNDPQKPGSKLIELDRAQWENFFSTNADVNKLVFHEYLWASGIDDTNYRVSSRLGAIEAPVVNGIGTWTELPEAGAPRYAAFGDRIATTGFWAAGRFVVIDTGSTTSCAASVRAFVFDPTANTWSTSLAPPSIGLVFGAAGTVVQDHIALWGGGCRESATGSFSYSGSGAIFDPLSATWQALPTDSNAPTPRNEALVVASGEQLFVWGGIDAAGQKVDGAIFDFAAKAWTPMSTQDAPRPGKYGAAATTATSGDTAGELLVWRRDNRSCASSLSAYQPKTKTWRTKTSANAPSLPCDWDRVTYTGTSFAFVFDDRFKEADGKDAAGISWNPTADKWASIAVSGSPKHRELRSYVWTGFGLIGFGGRDADLEAKNDGAAYYADRDEWVSLRSDGAPADRYSPVAVWSGDSLYIWGGYSNTDKAMMSGAIWRP